MKSPILLQGLWFFSNIFICLSSCDACSMWGQYICTLHLAPFRGQALWIHTPKWIVRSKGLGISATHWTAWRRASWSLWLACLLWAGACGAWEIDSEICAQQVYQGALSGATPVRRDEGDRIRASANVQGHSDIRMALWIIPPWGKGDQTLKFPYWPVIGGNMLGNGGKGMTLMNQRQWRSWADSYQGLEGLGCQSRGSGWYTTTATTILLCFLPPSSSLGILSHAKRLMLEIGDSRVITSSGM